MPTTNLDQVLAKIAAKEATLAADTASLSNIDAAIAQAESPRPAAVALVSNDVTDFNAALDEGIAALNAAKIAVPVSAAV